jgi:hypothetical protein
MKQNPKNITTEIIRDYPTRFYLDETELRRLVADVESLLKEGTKKPKIKYWVGLENGIVYETNNIETVTAEENSRSLTIRLLIIFAETENSDNQPPRRIIVHFSRGRISREINTIHLDDDWFNLNYEGISFRIKDRTRDATLKSIKALEERLGKLKRWHSVAPKLSINRRTLDFQMSISLALGFLIYSLSALLNIMKNPRYSLFLHTQDFLWGAATGAVIVALGIFLLDIAVVSINWIIPPTVIAIGDEIIQSKKNQKLREYIFWSIIVATVVGIGVNLLTR